MYYTIKDLPTLVRGDDWSIQLTITSDGSIVDITDYTFWLTLKSDIEAADPGDLQVTSTPGTSQEAEAGIIYINVPRTLTAGLEARSYNYDVQQVDSDGNVQTILIGKVKVIKDITRSV